MIKISIKNKSTFYRILAIIILLIIWELNSRFLFFKLFAPDLPSTFFPDINSILKSFIFQLFEDNYLIALWTSLGRVLYSFFLASFFGILIGLLSARFKILSDFNFYPFEFFRQLPGVAIIPFAIIMFGIGAEMKIFVSFFGCFFPIYLSTLQSLQTVDNTLLKTANKYGWNGRKLLFGIMLPAAIPGIVSILRVTLSIALILIITSEMIVGGEGLGARLVLKERSFDFAGLYAETLSLGFLGLFLNYTFYWSTQKIIFWKPRLDWSKK